ncbi:hypothetical protein Dda_4146 [Drechslerella dactyloides]|uniref:Zinc finger CHCC-type domain-containing protein n=1 Tax=Drechslerella dactyloides TaxID=74499 RepID=A0AAD6NJ62_DREDA|nr:hypothetical protein Dda_4146 [Drechslerella dactyloides]
MKLNCKWLFASGDTSRCKDVAKWRVLRCANRPIRRRQKHPTSHDITLLVNFPPSTSHTLADDNHQPAPIATPTMLRQLPRHTRLLHARPSLPLSLHRCSSTAASSTTQTPGVPVKDPSAAAAASLERTDAAATTEDLIALQKVQAPNRVRTWAKSQMPRAAAMVGPRFEQTDLALQPRPLAAIELIHEQPVRFVKDRVVVCDGGGGPLGHPKIFINVDKPEVVPCGYCGLPFANEHNRAAIVANGQGSHGEYVIPE